MIQMCEQGKDAYEGEKARAYLAESNERLARTERAERAEARVAHWKATAERLYDRYNRGVENRTPDMDRIIREAREREELRGEDRG